MGSRANAMYSMRKLLQQIDNLKVLLVRFA